jgi:hypothetical protein
MTYKVISYGSYSEPELIQATKDCEFCFLLTHTESQGIAYMEILSAGVPCFCWDQTTWNGYPATSVPYFSKQCGVVSEELQEDTFDRFYFNLGYYKPRQYIVENHNLLGSSLKYLEILNSGS